MSEIKTLIRHDKIFLQDEVDVLVEFISMGIVRDTENCEKCQDLMVISFCPKCKYRIGFCRVCPKCNYSCSVYKNSIFYDRRMGPKTWKILLSAWCK